MGRPKTKIELIDLSEANFERLMTMIKELPVQKRKGIFHKGTMNRNIRDVITHLREWHNMFLDWYRIGMKGEKPDMPRTGFGWKATPKLNREIWKKYQNTDLKSGVRMFKASHQKVMKLVHSHTDEELYTKRKFKWTGSTSMGSYLVSTTSSHYDWAIKIIKKGIKE